MQILVFSIILKQDFSRKGLMHCWNRNDETVIFAYLPRVAYHRWQVTLYGAGVAQKAPDGRYFIKQQPFLKRAITLIYD